MCRVCLCVRVRCTCMYIRLCVVHRIMAENCYMAVVYKTYLIYDHKFRSDAECNISFKHISCTFLSFKYLCN